MIERQLIEECREGSMNSFRKLIDLTSPFVFSVAFRMLGDDEKAKDVVQETLITIWQKISKIKSHEGYKSWVYRIVVNKCYDQLRRMKRNPEYVADDRNWEIISNTLAEDPSGSLENEELAKIITLLTNRLSPKQKAVFVLSEIEQMTNSEVSEILGMGKAGVKANLHHARKSISEMIKKYK